LRVCVCVCVWERERERARERERERERERYTHTHTRTKSLWNEYRADFWEHCKYVLVPVRVACWEILKSQLATLFCIYSMNMQLAFEKLFQTNSRRDWLAETLHFQILVLRCGAVCCSVLQCVAVCCNVLQCAAACDWLAETFSNFITHTWSTNRILLNSHYLLHTKSRYDWPAEISA